MRVRAGVECHITAYACYSFDGDLCIVVTSNLKYIIICTASTTWACLYICIRTESCINHIRNMCTHAHARCTRHSPGVNEPPKNKQTRTMCARARASSLSRRSVLPAWPLPAPQLTVLQPRLCRHTRTRTTHRPLHKLWSGPHYRWCNSIYSRLECVNSGGYASTIHDTIVA